MAWVVIIDADCNMNVCFAVLTVVIYSSSLPCESLSDAHTAVAMCGLQGLFGACEGCRGHPCAPGGLVLLPSDMLTFFIVAIGVRGISPLG